MFRYIHGSEDSLDVDVYYVMDKLPTFRECQLFCSDKEENRNVISIANGVVTDVYKGTIDEVNNGILATYALHEQTHPLLITRRVERDVLMKTIRVVRCFLSYATRSDYRQKAKQALKSPSWQERINLLSTIDYGSVTNFGNKGNQMDVYKTFAFQLGQILGLLDDVELYTKSSVASQYPTLRSYLYRDPSKSFDGLEPYWQKFLTYCQQLEVKQQENLTYFVQEDRIIDLKQEKEWRKEG